MPLPEEMERRTVLIDGFTIEERGEKKKRTIVGHAAVFDKIDGPGWFRERIEPGAFAETIRKDDIRSLFNHDPNFVLGRNLAGTLALKEDDTGLRMEITPPDTTAGKDVTAMIERGDVSQASFSFRTLEDRWETVNEEEVRVLVRVRLFDVGPVTFPFYSDTDVALRSREKLEEERERTKAETKRNLNQRRRRLVLRHKY